MLQRRIFAIVISLKSETANTLLITGRMAPSGDRDLTRGPGISGHEEKCPIGIAKALRGFGSPFTMQMQIFLRLS
jgi:hypothetical protein